MAVRPVRTRSDRWRRTLLLTASLLALAPASCKAGDASRWDAAIDAFEAWDEKNAPPRDPVLFVGSSSIRMWPTHRDFPDLPVVNRGFGGAHISDVNAFADQIVDPYRPRVIVFYCGDNDIKAGKTPERVLADWDAFVAHVRANVPGARIVYLPIKPSPSRWKWWPPMQQVNEAIRARSEGDPRLFYADVATPMLRDPAQPPPADLFIEDGLHLSRKGYVLWIDALRPVLDAALAHSGG